MENNKENKNIGYFYCERCGRKSETEFCEKCTAKHSRGLIE